MLGDTETLTSVTATNGTATLANGVVTYTAPSSGPDTIKYSVQDQYGDTASGQVTVTVDPGPSITSVTPSVVENGQTTEVGTVAPGLLGDTLTLLQTGGSGALALKLVNGVEEVIYTAPSSIAANKVDTVSYTISDQYNDVVTGSSAVPVAGAGEPITDLTANESISVGNLNSAIDGRAGNDTISAGDGADLIIGGPNDKIRAGNGADTITSGPNSVIGAGNGNDTVTAGANSTIIVGDGNDTVTAGANSTITVGNGNDTVTAGAKSTITVGNGQDTIFAGANDLINLRQRYRGIRREPSPDCNRGRDDQRV